MSNHKNRPYKRNVSAHPSESAIEKTILNITIEQSKVETNTQNNPV